MDEGISKDIAAIAQIAVVQKILEVICRTTGLGFSAVARVTDTKWIACAVRDEIAFGLAPGGELDLKSTICDEIRDTGQLVAIDHVAEDQRFCQHHTPKRYGFQSYISVPINLPDGEFFGTLCAIDPRPAKVNNPATIGMFTLFADLIAQHLDSRQRLAVSEAALASERETALFREQFMAVLGHDLRNPLAAIRSGSDVLRLTLRNPDDAEMVAIIQRSATRMAGLIDNVLDFARGRLGGGLSIHRVSTDQLGGYLKQIITELAIAWTGRDIRTEIAIARPVYCDIPRIAQLLSNLLANALLHGEASSPVFVRASIIDETFELSVTNRGGTIAPEILPHLFRPFQRGSARPGQQGLGLGLYIASEIAAAHDGTIDVSSSDGVTSFTFRMPVAE